MNDLPDVTPFERQNISFPPLVLKAAWALARREGRPLSQFIQELVRHRAEQTYGADWPDQFRERKDAA